MKTFRVVWKPTRGCVCIDKYPHWHSYISPKYIGLGGKLGKNSFWNTDRGLIWVAGNSWMYRVPGTQGSVISTVHLTREWDGSVLNRTIQPVFGTRDLVLERISRVEYLFGD